MSLKDGSHISNGRVAERETGSADLKEGEKKNKSTLRFVKNVNYVAQTAN